MNNSGAAGQMSGYARFPGPPHSGHHFSPRFTHRGPPPKQLNFYMSPHQSSVRQQVSYSDMNLFSNGANRQNANYAYGKNFSHPRPNFNSPPPRHQVSYGDSNMFASNTGQQYMFNSPQNPPPPQLNQQNGNQWQQNHGHQNGQWNNHFQNESTKMNGRVNFAENGMKTTHNNRKPWNNNVWSNLPKDFNKKHEHFPKKKKKPKVDKRDLAENNVYFCETCDRGYKAQDKYQEHIDSHVKCRHEGCSYTAHPKLVQLHDRTQHSSGLATKIWKLESPEDIAKWREERKRNFPTAETVKRKNEIIQEKIARGEVIETKTFGKMRNKGGKKDKFGKWKNKRQNNRNNRGRREDDCTETPPKIGAPSTKVADKDKRFDADPLSLLEGLEETVPDSDQAVSAVGGLATLMANYSDSDEEKPPQTNKPLHTDIPSQNDTLSKKEIQCVENGENNGTEHGNKRKRKRHRKNDGDFNSRPKVRKSTLLEKLLAPNIRRERNLVLQCVYHIVKENFFGVGSKKEDKEPSLEVTCDSAEGCVIKPETDGESCVPPDSSKSEETLEEKLNCKEPNHLDIKIQNVVVDPLKIDSIKECVIDDHAWA
eukprot:XP_011438942.1 PREDICTED: nuclear fragile X mental retardation-interacting protein 1 [Crassostrea gigas]